MGKRSHFRSVLSSNSIKAVKSKKATLAPSAFDVIRSRPHHSALNQSTRGQVKSQSSANERSISRRKESLLVELTAKQSQNRFLDRRIGANEEGKDGGAVERFIKERTRSLKRARNYNVDEEDGKEEELTHSGQALSTVNFASELAVMDSEDLNGDRHVGRIDASQVEALHFGGGDDPYSRRAAMRPQLVGSEKEGEGGAVGGGALRSKREVMEEVVLKSKMYRAEKAEETAAQATRVSTLDSDFSSIRAFLEFKDNDRTRTPQDNATAGEGDDDFMHQAMLLAEEAKVKAAERVKTPEEVAREERERMDRQERARLRRMKGEEEDEEEEEKMDHGIGSKRKRRREQEKRERREEKEEEEAEAQQRKGKAKLNPTDDDLVDNFYVDQHTRRQRREVEEEEEAQRHSLHSLNQQHRTTAEAQDEDEDEEEEEADDEDDDEEEEEEEEGSEEKEAGGSEAMDGEAVDIDGRSDEEEETVEAVKSTTSSLKATMARTPVPAKEVVGAEEEVPYVFPHPTSHRHFLSLLGPYPPSLHPLIYRRIHSYHFLALSPSNRGPMEVFFTALLTHFHFLCKRHQPSTASFSSLLSQLNPLTSILFDVLHHIPSHAAAAARQLLSTWSLATPAPADVLTAKLLLHLFPSSDARHNVVTPTFIHLAGALHFAPLRSSRDLLRALFTCQVLLHATQQSQRFIPEVLHLLYGVTVKGWGLQVMEGAKGESTTADGTPLLPPLYTIVFTEGIAVWNTADLTQGKESGAGAGWRVDLQGMFNGEGEDSALLSSPSFLCSLFALTLRLVTEASQLYELLPSYPELFTPFHTALTRIHRLHSPSLPTSLASLLHSSMSGLSKRLSRPRPSFHLPSAPVSIRLHTPAYVEGYQPGKDYDPVRERAEMRDLTRKMKKEKRGAEKEIRKDAEFVRTEESRTRAAVESAKAEKRRQAFRDMEAQARDTNLLQKTGKRKGKKESKE